MISKWVTISISFILIFIYSCSKSTDTIIIEDGPYGPGIILGHHTMHRDETTRTGSGIFEGKYVTGELEGAKIFGKLTADLETNTFFGEGKIIYP